MTSLNLMHVVGMIFTILLGAILHFLWRWTGQNHLVAIFSAVNESVWEHLKLIFVPFTAFTILEYFLYGNDMSCFFTAKVRAVVLGMVLIIFIFYTYTKILGRNYLVLDISNFIIGVIAAYFYSYQYLRDCTKTCSVYTEAGSLFIIIALAIAFAVFTFIPPKLGIFIPPSSKG